MDGRVKLSAQMKNLIAEYEQNLDQGRNIYLEDQEYHTIISYYEDELDIDRALETVEKAIQQYAFRSDFLNVKTRMLIKKGHLDSALETLGSIENIEPQEVNLQLLKVNIYILQRRHDEAIVILDELRDSCQSDDLQNVYVTQAFFYESLQEFDLMFDSLKRALIINPNHGEALKLMGDSVHRSRNYEESILLHKLIVDKHPYNHIAWYNLGSAYGCVGEYQKAIDALEYSFIINPAYESGYLDCAEYCCELKKYDMALDIYTEALEVFGEDFDILLHQAHCYYALGRIEETKRALFSAIEIDNYSDEALFLLSKCYVDNEDYRSAIKVLKKAIRIESNVEEYQHILAIAYERSGDIANAARCYKVAAESGFEVADYWEDFILFLIRQQQYDKAYKVTLKAEQYTFSYRLMYLSGCCHLLIGNSKTGIELLEEAMKDSFADHSILLKLPSIISDRSDLRAMITYYSKEV